MRHFDIDFFANILGPFLRRPASEKHQSVDNNHQGSTEGLRDPTQRVRCWVQSETRLCCKCSISWIFVDQLYQVLTNTQLVISSLSPEFHGAPYSKPKHDLPRTRRYSCCLLFKGTNDTPIDSQVELWFKLEGEKATINQGAIAETAAGVVGSEGIQCTCGNSGLCRSTADAMHMPACSDVSDIVPVLLDHLSHWRVGNNVRDCRPQRLPGKPRVTAETVTFWNHPQPRRLAST